MAPKKTSSAAIVQEVEALVSSAVDEAKVAMDAAEVKAGEDFKELEGMTTDVLRQLHQDALLAEDKLRKDLYNLRLRFANQGTDVSAAFEKDLAEARVELEKAAKVVKELESRLAGELKDIWGTVF